ncbi:MAG: hypothetical protein K0R54_4499 [Clostridiaceae bacterium]|nr:hypothetical protein [Clostridiaceae bacterium]
MKVKIINNSKRKGFTLIEIMVAVAIMLVLMGFLVPKLAGYRAKAMEAKAINTGKQIYSAAMTSYSMTNGEFKTDDVKKVIIDTTGASISDPVAGTSANEITVSFSSDSKNYSVYIDAVKNIYQVKDEAGSELYPDRVAATSSTAQ